jgi:CO/xanthine dehydrogenase Mo-binding subunit
MKKDKGEPHFIQDFLKPDLVHALYLRSGIASGSIKSIIAPPMPRDYFLILPADIPGDKEITVFESRVPILASESISYPGEPIALVCGPDPARLKAILSEIKVEYAEEWPLFSFESFSSDQIIHKKLVVSGDPDGFFSDGRRVIERTYRCGSQEHFYPEPQGAFVEFDYDKLSVHSSTQWPFHVRGCVATALAIKEEDVVVHSVPSGAHLDGKLWYPSLVAVHAALVATASKRPARILLTRMEDFFYSPKRSRSAISLKAALGEDGSIAALDAQIVIDMGAYAPLAEEFLDRLCASATGPYRCANARIQGYAVMTNTVPLGAFAGFGLSMLFFALESLVSEIVDSLEADQVEWRGAHLLRKGDRLSNGQTVHAPPPFAELSDTVMSQSDYRRKAASYDLLRKRGITRREGPLRGIGLSFAFQGNGLLCSSEDRETYAVECELDKTLKLTIRTSAVVTNPGTHSLWAEIASKSLDIPKGSVRILSGSTDSVPNSGPSTLSRNVTVVSSLIEKCVESIQKKRFRDPLPISVRKSLKMPRSAPGGSEGFPFSSLSFGAAVVEVEISGDVLEPEVTGIWLAIDGGDIISLQRACDAIENGSMTALSWASRERLEIANGQVPAYVYSGYTIPGTRDMHPVMVSFLPSGSKDKPRGIGELPYHLVPAAYARAVSQATGITVDAVPIDIDKIIREVGQP